MINARKHPAVVPPRTAVGRDYGGQGKGGRENKGENKTAGTTFGDPGCF